MEVVWSQGWEGFTVTDVHEHLAAQREIAYTTVMTTLSRLYDKELLSREKDGRRYIYQARMTRSEFIEAMTREVLSSLPPVGQETAVALLVERVAEADEAELAHLEALIRKRREVSGA